MSEVYTVSAKTVDEAIELATKLYGGDGREISHEIVSLPKKGFLGIGAKDAEIRVTVSDGSDDELGSIVNEIKNYKKQTAPERGYYTDDSREETGSQKKQDGQQKKARDSQHNQNQSGEKMRQNRKTAQENSKENKSQYGQQSPKNRQGSPSDESQPAQGHRDGKPSQNKNRSKTCSSRDAASSAESNPSAESPRRSAASEDEMSFAVDFVNLMIRNMNLEAVASPKSAPAGEEFICTPGADIYPEIEIEGRDTGVLIGHHGETLDAIQYLVNLALFRRSGASRSEREHLKITVDIENYRAKREETLRALARRMAARAVKYKRNVFLEPMNPYERRIIHSELQDYPDVSTHSVGSDTSRKIIITYEGEDRISQNQGKRRGRVDRGRGRSERQVIRENASGQSDEAVQNRADTSDTLLHIPTDDDIPLPTLDSTDMQ